MVVWFDMFIQSKNNTAHRIYNYEMSIPFIQYPFYTLPMKNIYQIYFKHTMYQAMCEDNNNMSA